jgi:hypothetical protein
MDTKKKICLACDIAKPLSDYYNTISEYYPDGHYNWCKECFRAYHAWRKKEKKKAFVARAREFKVEFE